MGLYGIERNDGTGWVDVLRPDGYLLTFYSMGQAQRYCDKQVKLKRNARASYRAKDLHGYVFYQTKGAQA